MSRPRLLDLFCGAGGAAMGYHRAGGAGPRKDRTDWGTMADWRRAMDIDWMVRDEITQAIPPAYTEYIGRQLLAVLTANSNGG